MLRLCLVAFALLLPIGAAASDRVALVVGMADYQNVVTLDNTVRDADAIGETLRSVGFDVTQLDNPTGDQFREAIEQFAFRSETADLALIYYAGHAVEVEGQNFLIPVDAQVSSNKDIQRQAISLSDLLTAVDRARKMRIVILDSCRDNPFGDDIDSAQTAAIAQGGEATRGIGGGRGLAPPSPDRGTLVAFAARPGERALDGLGDHSPFALALMKNLPQPGLEISLMFRQIRDDVLKETGNLQEPYTTGSLSGTPFYMAGNDGSGVSDESEEVAWSAIDLDQEARLAVLAEQGDTRSMVGLASIRLNVKDTRYAPAAAAQLLQQAADAGSPEAQFRLAQLYERGLGVEVDPARALALYKAAAEQNYPKALNDMGFLYFQGELGLERDLQKGLALFMQAADLRQQEAMFNVAAMIDDGNYPGKGPEDAANYLYQSLRSGSRRALEQLQTEPTMFKPATRKALQTELAKKGFYEGPIDGDFGLSTQTALAAAFGLGER